MTNDHISRAALYDYLRPQDKRAGREQVVTLYGAVAYTRVTIVFADGVEARYPKVRELVGGGLTPFSEMKERAFLQLTGLLSQVSATGGVAFWATSAASSLGVTASPRTARDTGDRSASDGGDSRAYTYLDSACR